MVYVTDTQMMFYLSRYYQSLFLFSKSKPADVRFWIEETLKYDGALELLHMFQEWQPPKFPITGHMLMEHKVTGQVTCSKVKREKG
jgi:hypothetical protein